MLSLLGYLRLVYCGGGVIPGGMGFLVTLLTCG